MRARAPAGIGIAVRLSQIGDRPSLPCAHGDLALARFIAGLRVADQLGCIAGAQEVGRDGLVRLLPCNDRGQSLRLRAPEVTKRDVDLTLKHAACVPFGLSVADEKKPLRTILSPSGVNQAARTSGIAVWTWLHTRAAGGRSCTAVSRNPPASAVTIVWPAMVDTSTSSIGRLRGTWQGSCPAAV